MSGIAGIYNLDGAPVDEAVLKGMVEAMRGNAPDAQQVWCSGNVGLGHAMLRVTPESFNEQQPCTIDKSVWITADARIDGRDELLQRLRSSGCNVQMNAPDVELILHAYMKYGDEFIDHLIGDFAFALWDARKRKLICVRDHIGVRPFFYTQKNNTLVFASDINALLEYPGISRDLDEVAVGDFLLFGYYLEAGMTIYRDIKNLPASSRIGVSSNQFVSPEKYWSLNNQGDHDAQNYHDCIEQFSRLLGESVSDRIRGNKAALEMSGGLDSTSIAAFAVSAPCNADITAYTNVADTMLPDDKEGYYAGLVASRLSMPIKYRALGDYALYARSNQNELVTAEPMPSPQMAFSYDSLADMSRNGNRVVLSGFAGDALFVANALNVAGLLKEKRYGEMVKAVYRRWLDTGTLRGLGLRALMPFAGTPRRDWPLPNWLNRDFANRMNLAERWQHGWEVYRIYDTISQFQRPWMANWLSGYECFQLPVIACYPFADIRLIEFMLGVPTSRKINKRLLRESVKQRLPEAVYERPKEGMAGDIIRLKFSKGNIDVDLDSALSSIANQYIDRYTYDAALDSYVKGEGSDSTFNSDFIGFPISLGIWLSQLQEN